MVAHKGDALPRFTGAHRGQPRLGIAAETPIYYFLDGVKIMFGQSERVRKVSVAYLYLAPVNFLAARLLIVGLMGS